MMFGPSLPVLVHSSCQMCAQANPQGVLHIHQLHGHTGQRLADTCLLTSPKEQMPASLE
ncbi:hypothetical protein LEMLEM_LOCUS21634 [Lemmus lemmus]